MNAQQKRAVYPIVAHEAEAAKPDPAQGTGGTCPGSQGSGQTPFLAQSFLQLSSKVSGLNTKFGLHVQPPLDQSLIFRACYQPDLLVLLHPQKPERGDC